MDPKKQLKESIFHQTQTMPFSIHQTVFLPPDALYLHWHPELEFLLVTEGELEFIVEEQVFVLQEGEGIFIPPYLLHRAAAKERGSFQAIVADTEWITSARSENLWQKYMKPVCSSLPALALVLKPACSWQNSVLQMLGAIMKLPAEQLAEQGLFIRGSMMMIWQMCYDHHVSLFVSDQRNEKVQDQLAEAIRMMHEQYSSDLTLGQLAALAHVSEGQFCRLFKTVTNMTPFHYLNRCRILHGCSMLRETDQTVSEIAMQCGYNTISYFNRKFIEITGMTPSEYRKRRET
ncbi:MAG: AraC family transcriptional regulator [Lachnospiraceae bacterium]|nr:AraC family transcriptional regulator [Lachnospiraceae bacterium]